MGSKNGAQQAPAPNPLLVGKAQTDSNVNTAIANSIIGNANEITPWGTVSYRQLEPTHVGGTSGTGLYGLSGSSGTDNLVGSQGRDRFGVTPKTGMIDRHGGYGGNSINSGYDIPQFEKTIRLSDAEQKLFDQQHQLGSDLNTLAIGQTKRLTDVLGRPIDTNGLPTSGNFNIQDPRLSTVGDGAGGDIYHSFADAGPIQRSIGPTNYEQARKSVEDAYFSRINPQLDRDREALESKLIGQGLVRGTEAFNTAMDESNRQANDARAVAVREGGQEQSRLAALDLAKGQFANTAQGQQFQELAQRAGFANSAQAQEFAQTLQRAGFNNAQIQQMFANKTNLAQLQDTSRERALQERLAMRNQPINEIAALMKGGQVTAPQFAQYHGGQVGGTDIGGMYYKSAEMDAAARAAEANRQAAMTNALIGGVAGLGGAGLYGIGKSDWFSNLMKG